MFGVPRRNAGIQHRIRESKKHLHVVIQRVVVGAETNSANCAQWPGGCSEYGPSDQYSIISCLSVPVQTVDATPSGIKQLSKVVFMRLGRRFGLSAEQKCDVWRRWKAGQT
ncbi:MAG TPA: hypothetical protein VGH37_21260, partial [Candidatus Acidoferrum sp.]